MAGVSARSISDIERGISRRPRPDTINRLTVALDLRGLDLERFLEAARGRRALSQSEVDDNGVQKIPTASAYVGVDDMQPSTLVHIESAVRREMPTVPLLPQPAASTNGRQFVSIQDMSWVVIAKGVTAVAIVVALALLILRLEPSQTVVLPTHEASIIPPIARSTPTERMTLAPQGGSVLDIVGGLELSPMTKVADGTLLVETGQLVSATFRVYATGSQVAQLNATKVAVRGPGACALGWSAPMVDFPATSAVTVRPGESYLYQQTRVFTVPGVYFAEPVKLGIEPGVGWGGIRPHPRVWFRVVDAKTHQLPDAECITPVPNGK